MGDDVLNSVMFRKHIRVFTEFNKVILDCGFHTVSI
jgi:hypothetical protein